MEAVMKNFVFFAVLLTAAALMVACSQGGSNSPILPGQSDLSGRQSSQAATSKATWGVWEIAIDTSTWQVTATPLRGAQYTVDVVTFLQKPAGSPANLVIAVTDVTKWLSDGMIGVDVGLKHPFPGLDQYTGFDVLGVFVAPGSNAGNYDPEVTWTNGDTDSKLLNADGYTRWMNPTEFPSNGSILAFVPGKLGTSNIGLFTSTINGYKYFADNLDKDQSISDYFAMSANIDGRGAFKAGSFNHRDYTLKFPRCAENQHLYFRML
jgi:hypothetical protein